MGIALWMGLSVLLMAHGHPELGALGVMALLGSASHARRAGRLSPRHEESHRHPAVPPWHPEADR